MGQRIKPEGSLTCRIAIVADVPGRYDYQRPFEATAGQILNAKLHINGSGRYECYITTLAKERPVSGDLKHCFLKKTVTNELHILKQELFQELSSLQTNVIVAMGPGALWALTGKFGIDKWRGSILTTTLLSGRQVKVIPTYEIGAIIKNYTLGTIFQFDLKKALNESNSNIYEPLTRDLHITPTFNDVLSWISLLHNIDYTYDIETSPGRINCIGFASSPTNAISIPTTKYYWGSISKLKSVLEALQHILTNTVSHKIGQNITYDLQYLMRFFRINVATPWDDTLIMSHCCYAELPKSLAFLVSTFTRENYYKDDLKMWQNEQTGDEMLWTYNAKDCACTYEVFLGLQKDLEEFNLIPVYNYMIDLLQPLMYMMLRGVKVDKNKIALYRKQYLERIEHNNNTLKNTFGEFNPYSSKQVMKLAYNTLGLKPIIKKGRPTADKKAIEKLATKHNDLKLISQIRSDKTIISNYFDMVLDPIDQRLRCSFNATGTETRRLSSSENVFGCGRNLQNLPKKIRDIVIADENKILFEADLAGAESRVVAYLSEDEASIRIFEEGKKIHTYTACDVFGVTPEEVEEDKKRRKENGTDKESYYYRAKQLRHSIEKAGSWVTVSEQLQISAAEAKKLIAKFYAANPNLLRWFQSVAEQLKKNRTIHTPFGDMRRFYGRLDDTTLKEAVAHITQNIVGHVINRAILNIYNILCVEYPDVEILLQCHDSVVGQCNKENKDIIAKRLPEVMTIPIEWKGRTFTIPVEIEFGETWKME